MARSAIRKLSTREPATAAGHFVVHDGVYRVVVVKNPEPVHAKDVVHAHCLEQSLSGRGEDVGEALADLAQTVAELIADEYLSSQRGYEPNIDPLLLKAFERKSEEFEGCLVIRRGTLRVRLERIPVGTSGARRKSEPRLRPAEISFLPLVA